jgi:hypothetical protein
MSTAQIPQLHYHAVRSEIRDCDCFLFETDDSFADWAISRYEGSIYDHVGMAFWIRTPGSDRLFCLEAKEGYGVRLYPVSDYIREGRKTHWFSIRQGWLLDLEKMTSFGVSKIGRQYIPAWKLVLTFCGLSRLVRDEGTEFCSKLYSQIVLEGGGSLMGKQPEEMDPADVAKLPFLKEQGVLVLDNSKTA